MKKQDEFLCQFSTLSNINLTSREHEEVWRTIEDKINRAKSGQIKRKPNKNIFEGWVAAAAALVIVVSGVGVATHSYLGHSPANVTAPNYGVPAVVSWNGYMYNTLGPINTVGTKLGSTTKQAFDPRSFNVYSIPDVNSNNAIAIEVNFPNTKYIEARNTTNLVLANYSVQQEKAILQNAQKAGINITYIPMAIAPNDKLISIENVTSNKLSLTFAQMSINESNQPITGGGIKSQGEKVNLPNGALANPPSAQLGYVISKGSKIPVLEMKIGTTYVSISSTNNVLTQQQIENIAANLIMLAKSAVPGFLAK